MSIFNLFVIAAIVSYGGSIPPGSINISVMQYAINGRKWAGISFALAAALIEFFYAVIAVKFQLFFIENSEVGLIFKITSGSVLIGLGIFNLLKKKKKVAAVASREKRNAFVKGALVALANPLAIPFWLAVTLYLESMGWVKLTNHNYLLYVAGVSTGTFLLLLTVVQLGEKFEALRNNQFVIHKMPGYLFIAMGIWTFIQA